MHPRISLISVLVHWTFLPHTIIGSTRLKELAFLFLPALTSRTRQRFHEPRKECRFLAAGWKSQICEIVFHTSWYLFSTPYVDNLFYSRIASLMQSFGCYTIGEVIPTLEALKVPTLLSELGGGGARGTRTLAGSCNALDRIFDLLVCRVWSSSGSSI